MYGLIDVAKCSIFEYLEFDSLSYHEFSAKYVVFKNTHVVFPEQKIIRTQV